MELMQILSLELRFILDKLGKGKEGKPWDGSLIINHGILELFIKHDRKSPNGFFLS